MTIASRFTDLMNDHVDDRIDALAHAAYLARVAFATIVSDLRAEVAVTLIEVLSRWVTAPPQQREERAEAQGPVLTMAASWAWQIARVRMQVGVEVRP